MLALSVTILPFFANGFCHTFSIGSRSNVVILSEGCNRRWISSRKYRISYYWFGLVWVGLGWN